MTTQAYIDENKTERFEKGDQVMMHTCHEATIYKDKVFTCQTDSFTDKARQEVVFLEDYSGYFSTQYLVKLSNDSTPKTRREAYLRSLIPAGLDYEKKYWKNFEKYAGYKGNGVYHWKGLYADDTLLLYLMGVLKSENIEYTEE